MPLLKRFDPQADLGRYTAFTLSDEGKTGDKQDPLAKLVELFRGWLVWITPLIWVTYFCSSFAIFLKSAFGVLFLVELGFAREMANNLSSIGGITGAIMGVLLLVFTEKRGPAWIAAAPALGIPLALLIGSGVLLSGPFFIPVILVGAITIGAGHAAVISITSIYYPSAVRSTGGGWASFMAKFAAVAAPNIGAAWFLGSRDAVLDGYLFTGLCLLGVVLGLMALSVFARRLENDQRQAAQPAE